MDVEMEGWTCLSIYLSYLDILSNDPFTSSAEV